MKERWGQRTRRWTGVSGAVVAAVLVLVLAAPAWAADYPAPPTNGYVVDTTGALTASTIGDLNTQLADFERRTTNEIAVAVVGTTGGDDIATYARTLFNRWGVGQKDKNNGVLLVVATADRKLRLEVGTGLTATFSDAQARELVDRTIVPRLRDGDLNGGVVAGLLGVRQALGDDVSTPDTNVTTTPVQTVRPAVDSPFVPDSPTFTQTSHSTWNPVGLFGIAAFVIAGLALVGRFVGGGHAGWGVGGDRCPSCGATLGWRGDHQQCNSCGYSRRMLRNAGLYGSGWGSGWGGGRSAPIFGGSGGGSFGGSFGGGSSDGGGASGSFGSSSSSGGGFFGGGSSGGGGASGSW